MIKSINLNYILIVYERTLSAYRLKQYRVKLSSTGENVPYAKQFFEFNQFFKRLSRSTLSRVCQFLRTRFVK